MNITLQKITTPGFTEKAMFHPKAARYPDGRLLMAVQEINGGDYYGPVELAQSDDNGQSWSKPEPIPPLGWSAHRQFPDVIEGVCDTVVDYDPASGAMVFVGHNVFYRNNRFLDTFGTWDKSDRNDALKRRGAYAVLRADGTWSERRLFDPPEFAANVSFCCGCGQRIVRGGGEWLIAFYSMPDPDTQCNFVTVYRMQFDGERFHCRERGNVLTMAAGRGLLEPSLMEFDHRVLLTLRAEDGRGYWSRSDDGLNFAPITPWRFDDGTLLDTSSTQQHFLKFGDRLFLSYVRNCGINAGVMRFRAPLFITRVNPDDMSLSRAAEQIVFPLEGDPAKPETVALSGNFMPARIDEKRWLILDGQCVSAAPFRSTVKIAALSLA